MILLRSGVGGGGGGGGGGGWCITNSVYTHLNLIQLLKNCTVVVVAAVLLFVVFFLFWFWFLVVLFFFVLVLVFGFFFVFFCFCFFNELSQQKPFFFPVSIVSIFLWDNCIG